MKTQANRHLAAVITFCREVRQQRLTEGAPVLCRLAVQQ
jgi:hypothetical protein